MKQKHMVLILLVVAALGGAFSFYGGHATPKGQQPLMSFSRGDVTPLKTAFNSSESSIRVLLMLSPT